MITGNRTKTTDSIYKCILLALLVVCVSCSDNKQPQRGADGRILKNGQFYDSQESKTGEVWICTGRTSHAYHSNKDCYGMQSCQAEKKRISMEEAVAMGRTPCHYCHEDDNDEQFAFIDRADILHTKSKCKAVFKTSGGSQVVKPVAFPLIKRENLEKVCSQCVTSEDLNNILVYIRKEEDLEKASEMHYQPIPPENTTRMMEFENVDELYSELNRLNFELCPIEMFRDSIKDEWFYTDLYLECINKNVMPYSLEEFEKIIGISARK